MKCICPKCSAHIDLELPEVPEDGTTGKCPECKAKFPVRREPFAGRALWKGNDLACAECGGRLGGSVYCPECNRLYPDYIVTHPKKTRESRTFWEKMNFSVAAPSAPKTQSFASSNATTRRLPKVGSIAAAVVLVLAIAGGTYWYRQYSATKAYAEGFVKALFVIKVGMDDSVASCTKLANDWKVKSGTGASYVPRVAPEDQIKLSKIKDEMDKKLEKVRNPPDKFQAANQKLLKLQETFATTYALAVAPPATLPALTDSIDKSKKEFRQAADELKAAMPPELTKELAAGKQKYTLLRDF